MDEGLCSFNPTKFQTLWGWSGRLGGWVDATYEQRREGKQQIVQQIQRLKENQ